MEFSLWSTFLCTLSPDHPSRGPRVRARAFLSPEVEEEERTDLNEMTEQLLASGLASSGSWEPSQHTLCEQVVSAPFYRQGN